MTNARRLRSAAILVLALNAACSGQIGEERAGNGPGPAGEPGGAGGPGATGPGVAVPGVTPEPTGPPCVAEQKSFAPARIWQITDKQYVNIVRDVLGITLGEEDGKIVSAGAADRYTNYSEGSAIDTQVAPSYQTAAEKVADLAEARMGTLLGSGVAAPSAAQVQGFITTRMARAWRRPLAAAEVAALMKVYAGGLPDGAARGFHLVLEAGLQAPSFLYRTELGTTAATSPQPVPLTSYELASALSFLFLDSAPDDALWARAQAGTLSDPAVLATEVDRLMKLPAARANMTTIASYWLGLAGIANRSRNTRLYPEWNEALKTSLVQSVQLFLGEVIGGGTLSDLLTSSRVYANRQMARIYGLSGVMGPGMMPVTVPGTQRSAGILSQPGLLVAANRSVDRADVVHRGLLVNDAFICGGAIPPAPPEAGDEAKKMDGTERERADARASKANCMPCHRRFDPPGLTFERYDALGRYGEDRQAVLDTQTGVTSWVSTPGGIDASAVLLDDGQGGNLAGPVDGLGELAARLAAANERVGYCVSRKLAEYSLGHNPDAENSCALKAVKQVLIKTGSFLEFFRALALSPGFRTRNPLPATGI
jgi:hypothetical protein